MRRCRCVVAAVLIVMATTGFSASVRQNLSVLLGHFSSLQGQFKQTTYGKNKRVLQKSAGRFWLKRPLQFRWETVTPSHQIVITNGDQLWIYDVLLQQATEQKLPKTAMSPARLLSGDTKDVLSHFKISQLSTGRFKLTPTQINQNFKQVVLQFNGRKLMQIDIQNSLLQTNVFQFSHLKFNQVVKPSLFRFVAPKNVEVIKG